MVGRVWIAISLLEGSRRSEDHWVVWCSAPGTPAALFQGFSALATTLIWRLEGLSLLEFTLRNLQGVEMLVLEHLAALCCSPLYNVLFGHLDMGVTVHDDDRCTDDYPRTIELVAQL
jgi:hypothetical protein